MSKEGKPPSAPNMSIPDPPQGTYREWLKVAAELAAVIAALAALNAL